MPNGVLQAPPPPQIALHLLDTFFTGASPIGRRVERLHLQNLFRMGASRVYSVAPDAMCSAGALFVESKPWEAGFFGCPTVFLTLAVGGREYPARHATAKGLLEYWQDTPIPSDWEYATIRVATDDVPVIQALKSAGFRMLVTTITLEKQLNPTTATTCNEPTSFLIDTAEGNDTLQVREIARCAFQYGRYWVEPQLPNSVAGEMHATWAGNCVIGQQADVTFVARRGGEAIGFLGAKLQQTDELNFGVIVLTAVAEKDRGRGVGGALVRTACAWARERSATSMIVRTEVPNTTAVRLYERHGFTAASSGIYLARWRKKERTYD